MGLIDTDTGLQFGTGLVWLTGGIGQDGLVITSSTSAAALFLAEWGPYGMAMDFTDASIAIDDSTGVLDYNSQGTVSPTTGALLGPRSKLTYSAPSLKLTEQADGFLNFQAHNLYANSEAPANQSVTTGMVTGGSYAITLTGSVSITLSGAATGTVTAGTTTFTAASGTLTCGSTSGSGTVHLRRTPSVSIYVKTPTVLGATTGFDLPYVYSSGVKTGILVEPAATNLCLRSIEFDNVTNWSDAAGTLAFGSGSVANAVTSVFGTVTADKVVPDTSSSLHVLRQVISYTSGTTYTQSLIVSSAGYNYVQLVFPAPLFSATAQANFDLATGVLGTVGAGVTASIEDMENGIYRVIATCTATGSGGLAAGPCFISSATSARTETWTPNGTDGLYFHHYQMETGTVATSPIITYGGTGLRVVDNIRGSISAVPYDVNNQTWFAECTIAAGATLPSASRFIGGNTAWTPMYSNAAGTTIASFYTSGAAKAGLTALAGRNAKIVSKFSNLSGSKITADGLSPAADVSTVSTTPTSFCIGSENGASNVGIGLYKKIAYFTRVFSDAEMQAIST